MKKSSRNEKLTFCIPNIVKCLYQVVTDFPQHQPLVNEFLIGCQEFVACYQNLCLKNNSNKLKNLQITYEIFGQTCIIH